MFSLFRFGPLRNSLRLVHCVMPVGVGKKIVTTAFPLSSMLYKFQTIPFGFASSWVKFQILLSIVLNGLLLRYCLVYLGDVVINEWTSD